MFHEQQIILMQSNVWEWTHDLLANTLYLHLESFCESFQSHLNGGKSVWLQFYTAVWLIEFCFKWHTSYFIYIFVTVTLFSLEMCIFKSSYSLLQLNLSVLSGNSFFFSFIILQNFWIWHMHWKKFTICGRVHSSLNVLHCNIFLFFMICTSIPLPQC
jgi:hypothetical protein